MMIRGRVGSMQMGVKISDGSPDDNVLLLLDAGTGAASLLDGDGVNVIAGVALGLEGRTLTSADDRQRWDWMLTEQQAMAMVGMLMVELSPASQAQLIRMWRADGLPSL